MAKARCRYCHELIDSGRLSAHEAGHRKLREDGQQEDYATLPPELRLDGDIDDEVPTAYVHAKCGVGTRMPDDIIRSYLVNPWMYSDDTYCCGCSRHVSTAECEWVETGENVLDYFNRLRAAKPEMKPKPLSRVAKVVIAVFILLLIIGAIT